MHFQKIISTKWHRSQTACLEHKQYFKTCSHIVSSNICRYDYNHDLCTDCDLVTATVFPISVKATSFYEDHNVHTQDKEP